MGHEKSGKDPPISSLTIENLAKMVTKSKLLNN